MMKKDVSTMRRLFNFKAICYENRSKKASPKIKRRPHCFVYYFFCTALAAWWMTDGPEKSTP
ncbi:hypothetical protein CWD94_23120 [Lysinibacillus xylanilyticus]|uniref:Uncharacterized protein n=1 Tax=Lysinibacillus xylanilyticus TaxID=582475 RepID=A0A2M9Q012_9BACI|nr:hypothetical protein CWD94_23120 [Lysinibacillus xylanilyticus]